MGINVAIFDKNGSLFALEKMVWSKSTIGTVD